MSRFTFAALAASMLCCAEAEARSIEQTATAPFGGGDYPTRTMELRFAPHFDTFPGDCCVEVDPPEIDPFTFVAEVNVGYEASIYRRRTLSYLSSWVVGLADDQEPSQSASFEFDILNSLTHGFDNYQVTLRMDTEGIDAGVLLDLDVTPGPPGEFCESCFQNDPFTWSTQLFRLFGPQDADPDWSTSPTWDSFDTFRGRRPTRRQFDQWIIGGIEETTWNNMLGETEFGIATLNWGLEIAMLPVDWIVVGTPNIRGASSADAIPEPSTIAMLAATMVASLWGFRQ